MTAEEFYKKHLGKAIDTDKGYGVQCVDLFKSFTQECFGISGYTTGNGWASGLWLNRKTRPYYDKFIEVSINDKLQNGDWVIWNNGSKSCPNSHVAMYYNGKFFGQNQSSDKAACLRTFSTDGVLGVLRPKMYIKKEAEYKTGNYKTLGTMNVRSGPGLNFSNKLVKDLTSDGKKNALSKDLNSRAVYKKGTIFTAKEIIQNKDGSVWAKTPSGYVTIKGASGTKYCNKL